MWHYSIALGCFPGWYWPSLGIPTELSASFTEGGIKYWYIQVSAKFKVQQGIISRNVSIVLNYISFFYLLYPKLMDYYQFLCILKLARIDIGFEQRSHHGSLFVICHKDHTKPDAVSILPWQDITATFSPGIFLQVLLHATRGQCLGSYIQLVEGAKGCDFLGGHWKFRMGRAESLPGILHSVVGSA